MNRIRPIYAQRNAPDSNRDGLTTRDCQVRASTLNTEARTVEAVLSTEQPVEVFDWERWGAVREILVMKGLTLPAGRQVPSGGPVGSRPESDIPRPPCNPA